jgi:hypothetical protein
VLFERVGERLNSSWIVNEGTTSSSVCSVVAAKKDACGSKVSGDPDLRQERARWHRRGGNGERRQAIRIAEHLDARAPRPAEPFANRITVNFDCPVHEVHDPVVIEASPGIDASLETAIQADARVGDLDDERGCRGMAGRGVASAAADDGDVRLRLGVTTEREWELNADAPSRANAVLSLHHELDRPRVWVVLGLGDDEPARHELDRVVLWRTPRSINRSYSRRVLIAGSLMVSSQYRRAGYEST